MLDRTALLSPEWGVHATIPHAFLIHPQAGAAQSRKPVRLCGPRRSLTDWV